jgi:hypothetical protein
VSKTLKIVGLGGSLADNLKSRAALQTALDGEAFIEPPGSEGTLEGAKPSTSRPAD